MPEHQKSSQEPQIKADQFSDWLDNLDLSAEQVELECFQFEFSPPTLTVDITGASEESIRKTVEKIYQQAHSFGAEISAKGYAIDKLKNSFLGKNETAVENQDGFHYGLKVKFKPKRETNLVH